MFILTFKKAGKKDNLNNFSRILKKPKQIVTQNGNRISSKLVSLKKVKINNMPWIDAQHLGSELSHYYTRYLATVNGEVAVVITMSSHKLYYSRYTSDFFQAIKSIRLLSKVAKVESQVSGSGAPMGQRDLFDINNLGLGEEGFLSEPGSSSTENLFFLIAIGLAIFGAFLLLRRH